MIKFTLTLPPVSWARPGQSGRRRYDTQKILKQQYGLLLNRQFAKYIRASNEIIDYPVFVYVMYHFHRPKVKIDDWHVGNVDTDNLNKFLFDVLQDAKILKNDKYIVLEMSGKRSSRYKDEIEIEIYPIERVDAVLIAKLLSEL